MSRSFPHTPCALALKFGHDNAELPAYFFVSKSTMKPQSCKAKGRRLQQQIVCDLYQHFSLAEGDLRSTSMGAGGEDIHMSAKARELIPFSFEAKNQERLNIWSAIEQCEQNCVGVRSPVVVMKKNNKKPYAVIPWSTFLSLISQHEARKQGTTGTETETIETETVETVTAQRGTEPNMQSLKLLVEAMQSQLDAMGETVEAPEYKLR